MLNKTAFTFFLLNSLQAAPPLHKRFNEIRMVMTHNSTSLRPGKSILGNILRETIERFHPPEEFRIAAFNAIQRITLINPNPVADQVLPVDQQLKDGVRAFKLPISLCGKEFKVCHTIPKKKAHELYEEADDILLKFIPIPLLRTLLLKPLATFRDNPCLIDTTNVALIPLLKEINAWLEKNTHEVLCFFLDFSQLSKKTEQQQLINFRNLLDNVGFLNKMYVHNPEKAWPTIKDMIAHNKRIVIIANSSGFESIGIRHKKTVGFGSTYKYKNLSDLAHDSKNPTIDWGTISKNRLFIVDNYTTPYISGNIIDAKVANSYHILKYRIKQYEKLAQQPATCIMTDFYHEPQKDIFKVISDLNNE